jgi:hypothetical protein
MSNINKIKELHNNFKENIETSETFEHTKGLLQDFGNYLNKHKQMFYVLLGATAMNIAAQAAEPIIKQYQASEFSQIYKSDASELTLEDSLMNFKKEVDMGNNVTNSAFAQHQNAQIMNEDLVKDIMNMKVGETIFVKNPFWTNSVIELKIDNEVESMMYASNYEAHKHQINEFNSSMIVDYTNPVIKFNPDNMKEYLDNFANAQTEQQKVDYTKFVLYHEAAHATRRQSEHLDAKAYENITVLKKEIQSDVSAMMLLGHESRDLKNFNENIDMIIKTRLTVLEYDSDHNTTYAMIELKNAVNNNPELLNMKPSNITEFAYLFSEKISQANFNNEPVVKDLLSSIPKDKESLLNEAKEGKNMEYMNYYAGKIYNKGIYAFNLKRFLQPGFEHRTDKIFENIESTINKDIRHDDFVAFTFIKNKKEFDSTPMTADQFLTKMQNDLTKKAENDPVITKDMVSMLKAKIKMDEMDYNVADIQNLVNQVNSHKKISKNNIKFEI